MADWSIKIIAVQGPANAAFLPDLSTASPGQPLTAQRGDLVSWNNATGREHWPWLVASENAPPTETPFNNVYLTARGVPPYSSSDSFYVDVPEGTTLYYCCKLNPAVRGSIVVVPFGQPSDTPTS